MQAIPQQRLRIALQKSGKLSNGSLDLLQQSGLLARNQEQSLWIESTDYAADFMFVRDDDIPALLSQGICDLGVIGRNLLTEYRLNNPRCEEQLECILPLGFAKCRLSIAAPKGSRFKSLSDLRSTTIATSYPKTLKAFLKEQGIQARVMTLQGSVELAPKIGIADVICDLVSTGKTLAENGLVEILTLAESEALLVGNPKSSSNRYEMIKPFISRIKKVVKAA
ncbi:MAG: ATP phosphoribosyltransferase [Gammaproteobacteria bacterium]